MASRSPRNDKAFGPGPSKRLALRSSRDSSVGRASDDLKVPSSIPGLGAALRPNWRSTDKRFPRGFNRAPPGIEPGKASSWGSSWVTGRPSSASAAHCRGAALGIELGTYRALSEKHPTRLSSRLTSHRLGTEGLANCIHLPRELVGASAAAWVISTPGQDQTGDLQRVGLAPTLDRRCLSTRGPGRFAGCDGDFARRVLKAASRVSLAGAVFC